MGALILLGEAAQLLHLLQLEKDPELFSQLHPIQDPPCHGGRAAPRLAWLQTSATWLLGSLGWGGGSGVLVKGGQGRGGTGWGFSSSTREGRNTAGVGVPLEGLWQGWLVPVVCPHHMPFYKAHGTLGQVHG